MRRKDKKHKSSSVLHPLDPVYNQAILQQTQVMVIIHCNERFHDINTKLNGEVAKILDEHGQRLEVKRTQGLENIKYSAYPQVLRYYLTYWLLQWDQHMYYHNGLLPTWTYEAWLRQRYENYNTVEAVKHLLLGENLTKLEQEAILRAIEIEQNIYRDGWRKAKQIYIPLKKGFRAFADHLDIVMGSPELQKREKALEELLNMGFKIIHEKEYD